MYYLYLQRMLLTIANSELEHIHGRIVGDYDFVGVMAYDFVGVMAGIEESSAAMVLFWGLQPRDPYW